MYFHKYSKYKPSNSSICESYIKPVGIFGNDISKYLEIRRKRRPLSLHRVPPGQSNKDKTYFSSVGSPCTVLGIKFKPSNPIRVSKVDSLHVSSVFDSFAVQFSS